MSEHSGAAIDRFPHRTEAFDSWISYSLGGADAANGVWLARLRGLALAGAAVTLPMTAWKAIGPLTAADCFLIASVALFLPRFDLDQARRLWYPALAVSLVAVGAMIGTLVAGPDAMASASTLGRFLAASLGAMLLVTIWRPEMEQIISFSWLWVTGAVMSAMVALLIPDLHDFLRPSGLAPHPNHLAIISVILVGISLGLVNTEYRRSLKLTGLAAAGILFAGIAASGSRAGLGAALLVGLLALIATRDRVVTRVAVGVAVVGAVVLLLGVIGQDSAFDRLSGGDTSVSDTRREQLNQEAWDRFTADPVTGVGFADVYEAHNFFLQLASGAGVLGIAAAVMITLLALRTYMQAVWKRMAEDPAYWALVAGFAGAVIGYLAASVFQNILWDRNVWLAIALMTWAAVSASGPDPSDPEI